eukprot:1254463-Rhodomonas_salina.1
MGNATKIRGAVSAPKSYRWVERLDGGHFSLKSDYHPTGIVWTVSRRNDPQSQTRVSMALEWG